ncbi:hypothetical protein SO802_000256 [Lithocarpus litseifolius]|uniref:DUF4283 domain-containing protein n=1 Tax=Lithocarpus litseifolius TaxID=425828 RepID=A0AAW2DTT4_9ROSI
MAHETERSTITGTWPDSNGPPKGQGDDDFRGRRILHRIANEQASMSEAVVRSREEDEELQRSTKKVKENHNLGAHHTTPGSSSEVGNSDEDFSDLLEGEKAVKFSGIMKAKIRAPWANALIVKVFGKTVGFHFLHAHILANLSLVAVWIRLPELPIKYYEPSTLRAIGETIDPVLRIDTHTAAKTRGRVARLCVQVNLNDPITNLLRIGGIEQLVQYDGLNSLCFGCGRVGRGVEKCPYPVRTPEGKDDGDGAGKKEEFQSKLGAEEGEAFGPWVLVTRKRKPSLKPVKDKAQTSHLGQSEHPRVEIREFKVGGSKSQKVVGEESVLEEPLAMMGEEPRSEKGGEGPLRSLIEGPLNRGEEHTQLKEVVSFSGWDWHSCSFFLPDQLLMEVKATPISFTAQTVDWITCIPVRSVLTGRGIEVPVSCLLCDEGPENVIHVLRGCCVAREFWDSFPPPLSAAVFYETNLVDWLRLNCGSTMRYVAANLNWGIVFSFRIWSLWLRRNGVMFRGERPNRNVREEVISKATEFAYVGVNGKRA